MRKFALSLGGFALNVTSDDGSITGPALFWQRWATPWRRGFGRFPCRRAPSSVVTRNFRRVGLLTKLPTLPLRGIQAQARRHRRAFLLRALWTALWWSYGLP